MKELRQDSEAAEECALLSQYLDLLQEESDANRQVKDAQQKLEAQVAAKYSKLSEDEIKTLVVDDKWLARLEADVLSELDRVSQALADRIRQLAERYASTLPQLTAEVESLSARVAEHLKRMGAVC
jgi:type I restriction enzyme M protein